MVIPDLRISIHTNEEGQIKSTLTIDHFSNLDIAKVKKFIILKSRFFNFYIKNYYHLTLIFI